MKMTLSYIVARSQEILFKGDFKGYMHWNDIEVVFHSSVMAGSKLDQRYNRILMNRNAVPLKWYSNSQLSDCLINSSFKKAYSQVVEYLESDYNITPGRLLKLRNILADYKSEYPRMRKNLTDNKRLQRYLRNLNDLRMHCKEMSESEIYDFSFDMFYVFICEFNLSKETLSVGLLIMYWLQRECDLIPVAVRCDKNTFQAALSAESCDTSAEKETKKKFRLFMRKQLELHLKLFIQSVCKESQTKTTSRDRILKLIKTNPTHTAKTMASCLGLSVQAIRKQIALLKSEKRLKRVGPDNGGKWELISDGY